MTATLTDRTYAVAWDDPAELDGKVDGGPFRARLQLDPATGHLLRWNGFVCPHFERSEIERYMTFVAALPDSEYGRVEFRGAELVQLADPQFDDEEIVGPTEAGLYPLGAFSWTWSICPPDLDPDDFEPTADELEEIGVDAGGRDGRGDIRIANLTAEETAQLAELRWNGYGYDRAQAAELVERRAAYTGERTR